VSNCDHTATRCPLDLTSQELYAKSMKAKDESMTRLAEMVKDSFIDSAQDDNESEETTSGLDIDDFFKLANH
jgi:hypothetical protein